MHAEDYRPETVIVIVIMILLLAFLSGCALSQPPPVIIEHRCAFAELNDKSKLPPVELITPADGCPFYRCLDEANALKLKEREIRLRHDANYARELYLETKQRCEN